MWCTALPAWKNCWLFQPRCRLTRGQYFDTWFQALGALDHGVMQKSKQISNTFSWHAMQQCDSDISDLVFGVQVLVSRMILSACHKQMGLSACHCRAKGLGTLVGNALRKNRVETVAVVPVPVSRSTGARQMPDDSWRVASRMEADVHCAQRMVNVMLKDVWRGRYTRAVVGQPVSRRPPPSPPPPYKNTSWDRIVWPLPSRHPQPDHGDRLLPGTVQDPGLEGCYSARSRALMDRCQPGHTKSGPLL